MALDIQPISRGRKTVMLLVLLAIFIGSLIFARVLVSYQHKPGDKSGLRGMTFAIPGGFEPVEIEPRTQHQLLISLMGKTEGGTRQILVFRQRITRQNISLSRLLIQEGSTLFRSYLNAMPQRIIKIPFERYPGLQFSGSSTKGFAILSATVVEDEFIAVLYRGNSQVVPEDMSLLMSIMHESLSFIGYSGPADTEPVEPEDPREEQDPPGSEKPPM